MFSKTCEYGIRALIFIAQKTKDGRKVGIKEIAKGIASPEPFIAKILQDLSRKKLVLSAKGPNGGFYLDQSCAQYSLADVVKAIDGDKIFSRCGMGLKNCSAKKPCPLHHSFTAIRKQIELVMNTSMVGDYTKELDLGCMHLKR